MKQLAPLLFVVLTATVSLAQQFEWHQVQRPVGMDESSGVWHSPSYAFFRFDSDSSGIVYADNYRWYTTNSGQTWHYMKNHVFSPYSYYRYNQKLFWGKYIYADTGGIYQFDNYLQRGINVYLDQTRHAAGYDSTQFYQLRQGTIYAILNYYLPEAKGKPKQLLISNDTGSSWILQSSLFPEAYDLEILAVDTKGKIFLSAYIGSMSIIYVSDDNGLTWDSVYESSNRGNIASMSQLGNGAWVASSRNSNLDWWLLECDSSGRNWRTITSLNTYIMQYSYGFTILTSSSDTILAFNTGTTNPKILRSVDRGLTWDVVQAPPGVQFMSSPFVDNSRNLYSVGRRVDDQRTMGDASIYVSTNYGLSWYEGGIPHMTVNNIEIDTQTHGILIQAGVPMFYAGRQALSPFLVTKLSDSLRSTMHYYYPNRPSSPFEDTVLYNITVDHNNNYVGFGFHPTASWAFFRSTDHGKTWLIIENLPFTIGQFQPTLKWLLPPPVVDRKGYIWAPMGTTLTNQGDYVYRSSDNGISWDHLVAGITNPNVYVVAESPSGFIFAGSQSSIYRTNESFFKKLKPNIINTNVVCFAFDSSNGIYAGTDRNGVIFSRDNGESWTPLSNGLPSDTAVSALMVTPKGIVIAATYNGLYTLTVGDTVWHEESTGLNDRWLLSLAMLDEDTYLVGTFNSGLYVNKPFPAPRLFSSVKLPPSVRVEDVALSVNYPNPFAGETKIRYEVSEPAQVVLEVFTLLGERIAVLENSHHEAGTYETSFAATDIPSGTYMYRLKIGAYTESRLVVKI